MAGKKKNKRKRPPCPDPELYEWVETREGGYWRKKKKKGSPVNSSLAANANATSITAPLIKRIRNILEEYTSNLALQKIQARLSGLLNKVYQAKGVINFSALKGFEFQEDHPLENLLLTQYHVNKETDSITLLIPVEQGSVKKHNKLVTDFYFEAILLNGDVLKDELLSIEYISSAPYSFINTIKEDCKLALPLPQNNKPWMLLLKVSCLEGNEMAAHAKHYGMKVVETGGDFHEWQLQA